ncbi:MAG: calcium-binding protein [Methylophilaceae bacterium]
MAIQLKQIAVGVALVALSGVASADAMIGSGGYSTLKTMEMMKMIDFNGDHMVTKNEFMTYYGAIFGALDTDNDGTVDATEWEGTKGSNKISIATGGYSRQLRTLKMMDAMDADKDHKITKDEFIKFHEAIFNAMSKGGTEVDGKGWLARNTGN